MSEIVDFLNAQYKRREKAAKLMAKYYPPPWQVFDRGWMARVYGEEPFWEVTRLEQGAWAEDGGPGVGEIIEHVALHGPDYVLADIESKRRILTRHAQCGSGYGYCDDGGHGVDGVGCPELLDLAAPFSGEPGYKEGWAI